MPFWHPVLAASIPPFSARFFVALHHTDLRAAPPRHCAVSEAEADMCTTDGKKRQEQGDRMGLEHLSSFRPALLNHPVVLAAEVTGARRLF